MKVKNPILPGFYPDPSICRVGSDFYLVNSSFAYAPGVPIFHSKDLAHWEQIGNVLNRKEQLCFSGDEISRGIFAPTIRYQGGVYYVITTNVDHGGNFIVTATNPAGPWTAPMYLGEEAGGIDPSLFFDTDGRCYYVGTRPNPKGVRYNGDWEIWMQELDLDNMCLIGESMAIWKGSMQNAIWPEGPHLYHIGAYYYLLHAEGGTGPEHSIVVARSKNLFQWFEGCPKNPVFTHRHLGMNYPVIYAGHGDFVDDLEGNWYVVMLASRPCKGHCSMGRETFLAGVIWEDDWPVINAGIGHLEEEVEVPLVSYRFPKEIQGQDVISFYGEELDDRLLGIQEICEDSYSLTANPGCLRLYTRKEQIQHKNNPSFLGIRQKSYDFSVSTGLFFTSQGDKEQAGLVLYQNHENHLRVEIGLFDGHSGVRVVCNIHGEETAIAQKEIIQNGLIEIVLRATEQTGQVWIKTGKEQCLVAEEINLLPFTTEEAGGFVGCTIGLYATSNGTESTGYADFTSLIYQ